TILYPAFSVNFKLESPLNKAIEHVELHLHAIQFYQLIFYYEEDFVMLSDKHHMICRKFGINKLTSFQQKVMDDLDCGYDVIGRTRTGEGKSFCYLSQAILYPNDLLLVITPTISLMRDQIRQCEKFGISAACLYHDNPKNDMILAQLQKGKIQALFVSPERLANHKLKAALQKIIIHMIAIDEVHCLIEWGSEFRPMYQNIGKFIRKLQHRPVIAAFSATIPPNDIPFLASV
ncbi:MAG: DEAD/DEAH box helicase, partial [Butyricicoccus sp.]|nr:DEAD/DEAH box helicase [Butyricicoccus sp.]